VDFPYDGGQVPSYIHFLRLPLTATCLYLSPNVAAYWRYTYIYLVPPVVPSVLVDILDSAFVGVPWNFSNHNASSPCSEGWQGLSCALVQEVPRMCIIDTLNLADHNLKGAVSGSVFSGLTSLVLLDLSLNHIQKSIPSSVGLLTQLGALDLAVNEFTGSVPLSIAALNGLSFLSLGSNRLTGSIPTEYSQLSKLTVLVLENNTIDSSIPSFLGHMSSLELISLASNNIKGLIPSNLGSLSKLKVLDLYVNKLNGTIPHSFGSLSNLQSLSLDVSVRSGIGSPSNPPSGNFNLSCCPVLSFVNITAYPSWNSTILFKDQSRIRFQR